MSALLSKTSALVALRPRHLRPSHRTSGGSGQVPAIASTCSGQGRLREPLRSRSLSTYRQMGMGRRVLGPRLAIGAEQDVIAGRDDVHVCVARCVVMDETLAVGGKADIRYAK
jgi:hypothetical protein